MGFVINMACTLCHDFIDVCSGWHSIRLWSTGLPATSLTATTALSAGCSRRQISTKNIRTLFTLDQVQVGGARESAPQKAPGDKQEQCVPDLLSGFHETREPEEAQSPAPHVPL